MYECDCIDAVLSELVINEANELSASFEDISVCADQTFSITPQINGGVPPFEFLWETGATTETLIGSVTQPTQYTVTITDLCGNSIVEIVDVGIQIIPTATLTGNYDLCEIAGTGIPILFEGNPPWKIGYSINGIEQALIENIQSSPYYLNTPTEGTYSLTTFNDAYCEGNVSGSALVEYSTFTIAMETLPPSCLNSSDGSIAITQLEAIAPFTIQWNIETEDSYLLEDLEVGTYTLNIIDGNGCIYERSFEINAVSDDIKDCTPIYIPNSFSPNHDGVNDIFSIFSDTPGGIESIISMQVYNRWGALMYEQTNFIPDNGHTGWQGDFNGKPLNAGVYVYKVLVAFKDGSTLQLSGDVTLLR